jgi:general secretion pathway protein N
MTNRSLATWGLLLGALAGLVWQAPAAWLASVVQSLSHDKLQLRQPQGTVWHGSAQWVLASDALGVDALALPQRLSWRIQPQADASVRVELTLPCCAAQALNIWLRPQWGGATLELGNATSEWPLAWLGGLGAPWNTMALEGQARLHTQDLRWQWGAQGGQLQGQAQMQLLSVSSRLSTLRPLGSYALDLQGGPTPQFQLSTLNGQLQLSGKGDWRTKGLHFEGMAQAQTGSEVALASLLGVLGQRQGNTTVLRWG